MVNGRTFSQNIVKILDLQTVIISSDGLVTAGRHDQTIHHASQCRDLLLRLQKGSHDFPMEATKLLCSSHYLIGQSCLREGLNAEAEKAFTLAAHVMQQCCKQVGGAVDMQLQIRITSSLGK